ncbi:MAG: DUF2878 domain-containing protein [Bacteroidetes bacterium]|nr:MAG: DUF2878 domain-containing protein [Bacteroidota bacterium]
MNPLPAKLLNFSLYQLGWFCCVLGAARGYPLAGGLAALVLLAAHLWLSSERWPEVKLVLAATLLGILIDSVQLATGVLVFRTSEHWPLWLPLWIFLVWAQFASLLRFALQWLDRRYLLAALLGLLGGPLAYWSGVKMGAASFGAETLTSILAIAFAWLLAMPLLLWLRSRLAPTPGAYRSASSLLKGEELAGRRGEVEP